MYASASRITRVSTAARLLPSREQTEESSGKGVAGGGNGDVGSGMERRRRQHDNDRSVPVTTQATHPVPQQQRLTRETLQDFRQVHDRVSIWLGDLQARIRDLERRDGERDCCDHSCPICLGDIHKRGITILDCGHVLHMQCFLALLEADALNPCPLCRAPILRLVDACEAEGRV
jgi:Ring finger domain